MGLFGGSKESTTAPQQSLKHITLSTGGINCNYEIIDAIFAVDSHSEGFASVADPNKAFAGVKKQLSDKCRSIGGDAVIDCEFEYRNAIEEGLMSKKQVIEIFAYGTAVKFV